jgi:dihydrofolate reductase
MRKLIVSTYATLDARVDDVREWAPPYDEKAVAEYHTDLLTTADGLLLGRRTYDQFARMWPARAGGLPYADRINALPKYVVSTTLNDLTWENSQRIEMSDVAALKHEPGGDLVAYGGRDLTWSLLQHGLVDEYRVLVVPVLLGRGRTLTGDDARRVDLDLMTTTTLPTGVVVLTYRPAG